MTTSTPSWGDSQAERVAYFVTRFCKLNKGEFWGKPLTLRPWQRELIDGIFEEAEGGLRKHRTAYIGLPRKNGKSTLTAALALYGLIADNEPGAEVYSCAGDRTQAGIVFREARNMVLASPELAKKISVFQHHLECPANGGIYRALSADAALQQGLNPSFVIFDEVHVQPDDRLWNAMVLGMGTRRQPLIIGITTAGYDKDTLAWRLYDHGQRIADGEAEDEAFFFRWWEPADKSCDWRDPAAWAEANPAFGDFLKPESFEKDLTTPENEFRRYRLNQWTSTHSAWLPHGAWDAVQTDDPLDPKEPVVLGFDGAWSNDSTGLVACTVNNPRLYVLGLWEPRDGEHVDMGAVEKGVRDALKNYNVRELAFDPARFQDFFARLEAERLPVVEWHTNSLARMVPATQEFYAAVMEKRLHHDGDPRLARHIANAVLKQDARGPRIVKESKGSPRKIDLAVCGVIAYDRALYYANQPAPAMPRFISFEE